MNLFGAWNDKDTINALAYALTAGLGAIGFLVIRVLRGKGEYDKVQADIVERSETRTNGELTRMLNTTMARVEHLEEELRERDKRYDKLQGRVEACESQRAAQTETISWMKRLLQNAGIISPDDDRAITPHGQAIPKRLPKKPKDPNSPNEDSVG
jgi:uncharacterized protein HemX